VRADEARIPAQAEVTRRLVLFCTVAAFHFVLSVTGSVLALPAAFAAQTGFWTAPVKITLAWTAGVLLWPLTLVPSIHARGNFGYAEIGAVSVLFGLAAVALVHAVRSLRSR
jgi:hypothetical protein